jgi:hypothetical protein
MRRFVNQSFKLCTYKQLLLDKFESVSVISLNSEGSARKLDGLLSSTLVVLGEERLDCDNDGIEIVAIVSQVG